MTGKLLAYNLKSPRVPLVVRVPQFENHCFKQNTKSPLCKYKIPPSGEFPRLRTRPVTSLGH